MNSEAITEFLNKNILNSIQVGELSILGLLTRLGLTFLIGILIFFIYKRSYQGVMYNRAFNISLVVTSIITSLIIMTITSNIVLSLGLVGALSIVRFRTAVKEAIDIVFMFWAIAVGLACGAGLFLVVIVASLFIALVLLVFSFNMKAPWQKDPYLIVLSYMNPQSEGAIFELVENEAGKFKIRSKTISGTNTELTLEVRLSQETHTLVDKLMGIQGMANALLVSYSNEHNS